jgi:hypothetical protein
VEWPCALSLAYVVLLGSKYGPLTKLTVETLDAENDALTAQFRADDRRATTPFPPALLEQIVAARRRKIRNKTTELARERSGEMTARAHRRKRQMLPGHLMNVRSPKERRYDRVVRSLSEVGYVGMIKERIGRGPKTGAWRLYEEGQKQNRTQLDEWAKQIQEENQRRRAVGNHETSLKA